MCFAHCSDIVSSAIFVQQLPVTLQSEGSYGQHDVDDSETQLSKPGLLVSGETVNPLARPDFSDCYGISTEVI